jgi:ribosomal protein L32
MPAPAPMSVANLPEKYRQEISNGRAYLANISDIEHTRPRTYGNYTIKACEPGEEYSMTEITPRRGVMDFGDKHIVDFPIMPEEIAADLAREINADAGDNSFLGVFVCGPDGPTKQELVQAHARLDLFYDTCIQAGDVEWQRSHQIIMIPDLFKRAAKIRRQKREWALGVQPTFECPGCGENLRPNVAVCKGCGCVINRARAIELGMIADDSRTPPPMTKNEGTKKS